MYRYISTHHTSRAKAFSDHETMKLSATSGWCRRRFGTPMSSVLGPQNWRNTWYPDTSIFAPVLILNTFLLKIFWANNIPSFTPAFLMRPLLNVPKSSSDHVAQGVQMCHWPSPVSKRTAGVTLWSRWKISLKKYLEFLIFQRKRWFKM